jgi:hypothetical protein
MDFNNVNEASGGDMVKPGYKGIFAITEVKDEKNTNDKQYLGITFTCADGSMRHSFYTSKAALPRIQHLWKKATQSDLTGNVTEQQIIAGLTGKNVGLKVTGRIGNNGKTYPDLSFGGFACVATPEELELLVFTKREEEDIAAALANLENQASSSADVETTDGAPAAPASDGNF